MCIVQATEGNDVDVVEAPVAASDDAFAAVAGPAPGGLSVALGGKAQAAAAPAAEAPATAAAPEPEAPKPAAPAAAKGPDIDLLGEDVFGNGELVLPVKLGNRVSMDSI